MRHFLTRLVRALRAALYAFKAEWYPVEGGLEWRVLVGQTKTELVPATPWLPRKLAARRFADLRKAAPHGALMHGDSPVKEW